MPCIYARITFAILPILILYIFYGLGICKKTRAQYYYQKVLFWIQYGRGDAEEEDVEPREPELLETDSISNKLKCN